MEFQLIKSSAWAIRSMYAIMLLAFAGEFAITLMTGFWDRQWVMIAPCSIGVAGVIGFMMIGKRTSAKNNASFSARLMDEYHATSDRTFSAIWEDLYKYNEASVVFTAEGKDVQIFVKPTNASKEHITMVFTMLDASAIYPQPAAEQLTNYTI